MNTLALIPARSGSKGIPGKNFRRLPDGLTCVERTIDCAWDCNIPLDPWLTTDSDEAIYRARRAALTGTWSVSGIIQRPAKLAQDDTPMIDVVKHALAQVPGPPEQIIVLLQPTQPLRTPAHVKAAIDLLESSGADSVVSVVELPASHHPELVLDIDNYGFMPWVIADAERSGRYYGHDPWALMPSRRQALPPVYIRDGTVYAFRRSTVDNHGTIYGRAVRPLVIPASESCELDTPEDWERLEARIRATMKKDPAVCGCEQPTPHTRPSGAVICVNDSCGALIVPRQEPVARP